VDIQAFLATTQFPGEVVYAKLWGSRSHNTHLPGSDEDFLAVYRAPTNRILSLHPPPDTVDSPEGQKPDFQAHEVAKFCRLLMKGNPGIVEMLFTEKFDHTTQEWHELREHRNDFLTQTAVRQYLGYAEGQLKKLFAHSGEAGLHTKGGKFSEKWAYHLVRLLGDAKRIAEGGKPVVWKDGEERDLLMQIRTGGMPHAEIERYARSLLAEIDGMKPWGIPEDADESFLEDWLLHLR
jgi:predicted nucleotidyltransferase